jgi:hypothetical protein
MRPSWYAISIPFCRLHIVRWPASSSAASAGPMTRCATSAGWAHTLKRRSNSSLPMAVGESPAMRRPSFDRPDRCSTAIDRCRSSAGTRARQTTHSWVVEDGVMVLPTMTVDAVV